MPKSRTTWSVLIGVVLLVVLLGIGVLPRVRQNAELVAASTAPDAGLVQVSVAPPRRADGLVDLVLPSNIQAIEEATIYARTNGYIRERYADIGDRVAAGKALAQIDTPELDQELSQARAALAQTRSGLAVHLFERTPHVLGPRQSQRVRAAPRRLEEALRKLQ